VDRFSVLAWVSLLVAELAIVISRPSRIHAGAQPEYQPSVERRPAQPVQPGRDGTADRLLLLFRRDDGHAKAHPAKATMTAVMLTAMSYFSLRAPATGSILVSGMACS
jgi:hypothetical protein